MFIARIPKILSKTFRGLTWELARSDNKVYLTFDDGPTPGVTEWVLELLDSYQVKATFFCLGKNVKDHPNLFSRTIKEGHQVGNHSYGHLKGFRTASKVYIQDVNKAAELIKSKLFRPPYGRILPGQVKRLKRDFNIIMWTVLSVDYNRKISGEQVVKNVVENVKPGSIIVFHDSNKAKENLKFALPRVIEYLQEKNYQFGTIPEVIK